MLAPQSAEMTRWSDKARAQIEAHQLLRGQELVWLRDKLDAYVAALPGPGGHTHVLIAGTRDVGLMHAAGVAADPGRQQELARQQ